MIFIKIISIFYKGKLYGRKYVSLYTQFRKHQYYWNLQNFPIGLNPARSMAPALWTGDFELLWVRLRYLFFVVLPNQKKTFPRFQIYLLAPLSGAAVSAITYKYVFRREIIEAENCGQHLDNLCDAADKA